MVNLHAPSALPPGKQFVVLTELKAGWTPHSARVGPIAGQDAEWEDTNCRNDVIYLRFSGHLACGLVSKTWAP
jgi:hypothetical protein